MNRREFLKKSAVGLGGLSLYQTTLGIFLTNLVQSQLNRAYALGTSGENAFLEKKLINIILAGGPPRNFFDLPLNPDNVSNGFQLSPLLANKLVADASSAGVAGYRGVHESVTVDGYQMPYFWAGSIPTPGGATEAKNLASSMICMRGLSVIDSHSGSRAMMLRPNSGNSVDGLVADRSKALFPALGIGADGVSLFENFYRSKSGIPLSVVRGNLGDPATTKNDALSNLFAPFLNKANLRSNSGVTSTAMDAALDAMKTQSGDFHKMVPSSFLQRSNAKAMMQKSFGNLSDAFASRYARYQSLMIRSFTEAGLRLSGADSFSISGLEHPFFQTRGSGVYQTGDVSAMLDRTSYIANLASSFAIAEYMVMGDPTLNESFTSAAQLMLSHYANVQFSTSKPVDKVLYLDAHYDGAYVQLYNYTRYYRAIAACIYELIQNLKGGTNPARNRFKDTVITLTSEFNRIPIASGSGSDHGNAGSNYTLFTGMTDQLQVYGDVHTPNKNVGTWGAGAPVPEFGGQVAVIGNAVSSVCSLLDLPTPTPNNVPFVKKDESGKAVGTIKRRPLNAPVV